MRSEDLRIAVAVPLSGPSALLGQEMRQAIDLAVDEHNSTGEIAGMKIACEVIDDEGNPTKGTAIAQALCANPLMLAIVGHYNSDVTIESLPRYAACDLPLITPIASNPAVTDHRLPNVFRFTNRDDETSAALADYLYRNLNKRRAVVIESTTMYGKSMAREFTRAFRERGGQLIDHREARDGQRDFALLVSELPADFDLLFYGGSFEGAFILRAMRAAGLDQLFAAGDGCWDLWNFLKPAGEVLTAGEGVLVLSATPELGRIEGSREFAERYSRRFGPIGNYAVNSYDTARLLFDAIDLAASDCGGRPDRRTVLEAIRRVRFKGIAYARPVEWNDRGDNQAAVTALHVVADGRFQQVAEIPCSANAAESLQ